MHRGQHSPPRVFRQARPTGWQRGCSSVPASESALDPDIEHDTAVEEKCVRIPRVHRLVVAERGLARVSYDVLSDASRDGVEQDAPGALSDLRSKPGLRFRFALDAP